MISLIKKNTKEKQQRRNKKDFEKQQNLFIRPPPYTPIMHEIEEISLDIILLTPSPLP